VQSRITEVLPGFDAERTPEVALALRRGSLSQSFHEEQRALLDELPQLRDGLPRLSASTTVVVGTHDRVTSPADGRTFAAAVGAHLVELDGGHLLPLQRPDDVADAIAAA
jgi:pimeloyl-ACP methyl ester carboxylesterase